MSWKKESAAAGLAGLTPREAARGAMYRREFQKMPDPLAGVLPDPLAGVKKEDMFMLVSTVYCRSMKFKLHSMVRMSKQSIHCLNSVHVILASNSKLVEILKYFNYCRSMKFKLHSMVRMSKQSIHCLNSVHLILASRSG